MTDETGTYKIELKDSHVEDICEIVLVQSPLANCHEIQNLRDRAPVLLTRNVGISDNLRLANPLGYLKDVPLPVCGDLLPSSSNDNENDNNDEKDDEENNDALLHDKGVMILKALSKNKNERFGSPQLSCGCVPQEEL